MGEPIYNMNDLMKRVKRLQIFTIERDLPEDFIFTGTVPYDMKISDNTAFIKIYAADLSEANQKIDEFFENRQ